MGLKNTLYKRLVKVFLIGILLIGTVALFTTYQHAKVEERIITLLDKHTLFTTYQYYKTQLKGDLSRSALPIDTASVRQNLGEMLSCAEEMQEAFPQRQIQDFYHATKAFSQMNLEIESLETLEGCRTYLPGVRYTLELIEAQFPYVNEAITESTRQQCDTLSLFEKRQLILSIAFILSTAAFCLAFCLIFSRNLLAPFSALTQAANGVAHADFAPALALDVNRSDEFGLLMNAFSTMAGKVQDQISLLKEKALLENQLRQAQIQKLETQKLLRETELMALQMEINPHFLFNSMNLLRQMAFLEEAKETGEIIEALGDILRYSLGGMRKPSTLAQELENVNGYMFIQQKRFGQDVAYRVWVEQEEALPTLLPALILQPLAENYYKYGRREDAADNFFEIHIFQKEDSIYIQARDNGKGISPQKLQTIRESLQNSRDFGDGIGLKNIAARLSLFFRQQGELSVESEGGLTCVTIRVPIATSAPDWSELAPKEGGLAPGEVACTK